MALSGGASPHKNLIAKIYLTLCSMKLAFGDCFETNMASWVKSSSFLILQLFIISILEKHYYD